MDQEKLSQLQHALLSAFPSRTNLAQLVYLRLGINLEEIAAEGNLKQAVFELLQWAQAHAQLARLVAAAREENPGNEVLRVFAAQAGWTLPNGAPSVPGSPKELGSPGLPGQPTSLIGRKTEIAACCKLLRQKNVQLLSLIGAPGIGKTRLGLAVAGKVQANFRDGVYFVDLTPLSDPALVISSIAGVIGLQEEGDQPLPEILKRYLLNKRLLLVLDNFEHLLDAAPQISALLTSAPGLKVLVTSQARLNIRAEHPYEVPALGLPDLTQPAALQGLAESDAVRLFIARSQEIKPDFVLRAGDARAVAEICVGVDGLPLAIELAAAWSKILSPQDLRARLGQRLEWLVEGRRDVPRRHQTLQALLDWSYNLLKPGEQQLLCQLAIFVGGCTAEAIQAICAVPLPDASQLPPADQRNVAVAILAALRVLVDHSLLLRIEGVDGQPRFQLLQVINEYAGEQLKRRGGGEAVRQAHTDYYLRLIEIGKAELHGPQQRVWLERFMVELDNIRAVMSRTLDQAEAAKAGQLVIAAWEFMWTRGHLSEMRQWLKAVLDLAQLPNTLRASVLNASGILAHEQGDYTQAAEYFYASLALRREAGDKRSLADSLNNLGVWACNEGRYEQAHAFCDECLALEQELGNQRGIAVSLSNLGIVAHCQQEVARAAELYQQSLALHEELGSKQDMIRVLTNMGELALDQDQYDQAEGFYTQSLKLTQELNDKYYIAECLEGLAGAAAGQRQATYAARLFAAATALRTAIGAVRNPASRATNERLLALARSQVDAATWVEAWSIGQTLRLEQIVTEAIGRGQEMTVVGDDASRDVAAV